MVEMGSGGGYKGMLAGFALVTAGIALTAKSYQAASPAGVYVVVVGLVAGGLFRMVASANTPRLMVGRVAGYGHPAPDAFTDFYAPPSRVPEGVCWQCGAHLRGRSTLCYACGATRPATHHLTAPPAPIPPTIADDPSFDQSLPLWTGTIRGPEASFPMYRPGGDYSQADDAPSQADDAPSQADDAPSQADDAPSQVDDAPSQADDAPLPPPEIPSA